MPGTTKLFIRVERDQPDNNVYMATYSDYENLQESPVGFGYTPAEAVADLQTDGRELEF